MTPSRSVPVTAERAMVATSHPLAVEIGVDILRGGGNAIDAAVAVNAAIGLMEPMSCGIGGDLFAIVYIARERKLYGLNASGRAPLAASIDEMRARGISEIPLHGPLSWSVPGCVDGWDVLLRRFGTMPLSRLLEPSIHYAERGVAVPPVISQLWENSAALLWQHPDAARTYLPDGRAPRAGEIFVNRDLAETYRLLARDGRDAFYRGPIAQQIVAFSQQVGGLFSLADFENHTSTWVAPVSCDYRGVRVWELPPPGQGISVLQMLNLLEGFDVKRLGAGSADWWHLFLEAKKLAYADRARYYADPEFAKVPTETLISKQYADQRRALIDMKRAAADVPPGDVPLTSDTIYACVVDEERNCVSLIQSNYKGFGSGLVPGRLGFALQNRGNLFALDPHHANALKPGKRPFHTIIPAMVTKNDRPWFVFGVMGGDMQPQGQVQVLVNFLDFGMDIQQAGDAPRLEHLGSATPTGLPSRGVGTVQAEPAIPDDVVAELQRRGHHVERVEKNTGGYQGILIDESTGTLLGASESRKDGKAMGY